MPTVGRFHICLEKTILRGIRGCNLSLWREDMLACNGYNEDFTGWGREDSELAARLMNSGCPPTGFVWPGTVFSSLASARKP